MPASASYDISVTDLGWVFYHPVQAGVRQGSSVVADHVIQFHIDVAKSWWNDTAL